ncbi:MAG TPA: pseudouridine synthase [Terriglobales bacterium]|nr:pseudouridine synthase [Terriglobales bacterium]
MPAERLQKIIAAAGIASRRKAEQLITAGLVSVNGQIVTELGAKADLEQDHIKVNGKLLQGAQRHAYFLLHKPKGYVTTSSDPEGRPTVLDLIKEPGLRLYPVGRLDYATEGLLLITNDGDLANLLTKASSHFPKTYLVKVSGVPAEEAVEKLRAGVKIQEGEGKSAKYVRTAPARVALFKRGDNPWFEVTLIEGRNRQIRKMFEVVGHRVEKIKRVRYGPLQLDVDPGKYRSLTMREVAQLKTAALGKKHSAPKPRQRPA